MNNDDEAREICALLIAHLEKPFDTVSAERVVSYINKLRAHALPMPKVGDAEYGEPWRKSRGNTIESAQGSHLSLFNPDTEGIRLSDRTVLCVNALAGLSDADVVKLGEWLRREKVHD
jgi:hypothetical protein